MAEDDRNGFAVGLEDCCGGGLATCCSAFFCPCIAFGKTIERVARTSGDEDDDIILRDAHSNCIIYGLLCAFSWPWACIPLGLFHGWGRNVVRHGGKFDPDTLGDDFMTAWCCAPCAIVQEERHVDAVVSPVAATDGGL